MEFPRLEALTPAATLPFKLCITEDNRVEVIFGAAELLIEGTAVLMAEVVRSSLNSASALVSELFSPEIVMFMTTPG